MPDARYLSNTSYSSSPEELERLRKKKLEAEGEVLKKVRQHTIGDRLIPVTEFDVGAPIMEEEEKVVIPDNLFTTPDKKIKPPATAWWEERDAKDIDLETDILKIAEDNYKYGKTKAEGTGLTPAQIDAMDKVAAEERWLNLIGRSKQRTVTPNMTPFGPVPGNPVTVHDPKVLPGEKDWFPMAIESGIRGLTSGLFDRDKDVQEDMDFIFDDNKADELRKRRPDLAQEIDNVRKKATEEYKDRMDYQSSLGGMVAEGGAELIGQLPYFGVAGRAVSGLKIVGNLMKGKALTKFPTLVEKGAQLVDGSIRTASQFGLANIPRSAVSADQTDDFIKSFVDQELHHMWSGARFGAMNKGWEQAQDKILKMLGKAWGVTPLKAHERVLNSTWGRIATQTAETGYQGVSGGIDAGFIAPHVAPAIPRLPGESDEAYENRMKRDMVSQTLIGMMLSFQHTKPAEMDRYLKSFKDMQENAGNVPIIADQMVQNMGEHPLSKVKVDADAIHEALTNINKTSEEAATDIDNRNAEDAQNKIAKATEMLNTLKKKRYILREDGTKVYEGSSKVTPEEALLFKPVTRPDTERRAERRQNKEKVSKKKASTPRPISEDEVADVVNSKVEEILSQVPDIEKNTESGRPDPERAAEIEIPKSPIDIPSPVEEKTTTSKKKPKKAAQPVAVTEEPKKLSRTEIVDKMERSRKKEDYSIALATPDGVKEPITRSGYRITMPGIDRAMYLTKLPNAHRYHIDDVATGRRVTLQSTKITDAMNEAKAEFKIRMADPDKLPEDTRKFLADIGLADPLPVKKEKAPAKSPVTVETNSGKVTVHPDGKMFYANGKEVTTETVRNKAMIRADYDPSRRITNLHKLDVYVTKDNKIISLGKTNAGTEILTSKDKSTTKKRADILNEMVKQTSNKQPVAVEKAVEKQPTKAPLGYSYIRIPKKGEEVANPLDPKTFKPGTPYVDVAGSEFSHYSAKFRTGKNAGLTVAAAFYLNTMGRAGDATYQKVLKTNLEKGMPIEKARNDAWIRANKTVGLERARTGDMSYKDQEKAYKKLWNEFFKENPESMERLKEFASGKVIGNSFYKKGKVQENIALYELLAAGKPEPQHRTETRKAVKATTPRKKVTEVAKATVKAVEDSPFQEKIRESRNRFVQSKIKQMQFDDGVLMEIEREDTFRFYWLKENNLLSPEYFVNGDVGMHARTTEGIELLGYDKASEEFVQKQLAHAKLYVGDKAEELRPYFEDLFYNESQREHVEVIKGNIVTENNALISNNWLSQTGEVNGRTHKSSLVPVNTALKYAEEALNRTADALMFTGAQGDTPIAPQFRRALLDSMLIRNRKPYEYERTGKKGRVANAALLKSIQFYADTGKDFVIANIFGSPLSKEKSKAIADALRTEQPEVANSILREFMGEKGTKLYLYGEGITGSYQKALSGILNNGGKAMDPIRNMWQNGVMMIPCDDKNTPVTFISDVWAKFFAAEDGFTTGARWNGKEVEYNGTQEKYINHIIQPFLDTFTEKRPVLDKNGVPVKNDDGSIREETVPFKEQSFYLNEEITLYGKAEKKGGEAKKVKMKVWEFLDQLVVGVDKNKNGLKASVSRINANSASKRKQSNYNKLMSEGITPTSINKAGRDIMLTMSYMNEFTRSANILVNGKGGLEGKAFKDSHRKFVTDNKMNWDNVMKRMAAFNKFQPPPNMHRINKQIENDYIEGTTRKLSSLNFLTQRDGEVYVRFIMTDFTKWDKDDDRTANYVGEFNGKRYSTGDGALRMSELGLRTINQLYGVKRGRAMKTFLTISNNDGSVYLKHAQHGEDKDSYLGNIMGDSIAGVLDKESVKLHAQMDKKMWDGKSPVTSDNYIELPLSELRLMFDVQEHTSTATPIHTTLSTDISNPRVKAVYDKYGDIDGIIGEMRRNIAKANSAQFSHLSELFSTDPSKFIEELRSHYENLGEVEKLAELAEIAKLPNCIYMPEFTKVFEDFVHGEFGRIAQGRTSGSSVVIAPEEETALRKSIAAYQIAKRIPMERRGDADELANQLYTSGEFASEILAGYFKDHANPQKTADMILEDIRKTEGEALDDKGRLKPGYAALGGDALDLHHDLLYQDGRALAYVIPSENMSFLSGTKIIGRLSSNTHSLSAMYSREVLQQVWGKDYDIDKIFFAIRSEELGLDTFDKLWDIEDKAMAEKLELYRNYRENDLSSFIEAAGGDRAKGTRAYAENMKKLGFEIDENEILANAVRKPGNLNWLEHAIKRYQTKDIGGITNAGKAINALIDADFRLAMPYIAIVNGKIEVAGAHIYEANPETIPNEYYTMSGAARTAAIDKKGGNDGTKMRVGVQKKEKKFDMTTYIAGVLRQEMLRDKSQLNMLNKNTMQIPVAIQHEIANIMIRRATDPITLHTKLQNQRDHDTPLTSLDMINILEGLDDTTNLNRHLDSEEDLKRLRGQIKGVIESAIKSGDIKVPENVDFPVDAVTDFYIDAMDVSADYKKSRILDPLYRMQESATTVAKALNIATNSKHLRNNAFDSMLLESGLERGHITSAMRNSGVLHLLTSGITIRKQDAKYGKMGINELDRNDPTQDAIYNYLVDEMYRSFKLDDGIATMTKLQGRIPDERSRRLAGVGAYRGKTQDYDSFHNRMASVKEERPDGKLLALAVHNNVETIPQVYRDIMLTNMEKYKPVIEYIQGHAKEQLMFTEIYKNRLDNNGNAITDKEGRAVQDMIGIRMITPEEWSNPESEFGYKYWLVDSPNGGRRAAILEDVARFNVNKEERYDLINRYVNGEELYGAKFNEEHKKGVLLGLVDPENPLKESEKVYNVNLEGLDVANGITTDDPPVRKLRERFNEVIGKTTKSDLATLGMLTGGAIVGALGGDAGTAVNAAGMGAWFVGAAGLVAVGSILKVGANIMSNRKALHQGRAELKENSGAIRHGKAGKLHDLYIKLSKAGDDVSRSKLMTEVVDDYLRLLGKVDKGKLIENDVSKSVREYIKQMDKTDLTQENKLSMNLALAKFLDNHMLTLKRLNSTIGYKLTALTETLHTPFILADTFGKITMAKKAEDALLNIPFVTMEGNVSHHLHNYSAASKKIRDMWAAPGEDVFISHASQSMLLAEEVSNTLGVYRDLAYRLANTPADLSSTVEGMVSAIYMLPFMRNIHYNSDDAGVATVNVADGIKQFELYDRVHSNLMGTGAVSDNTKHMVQNKKNAEDLVVAALQQSGYAVETIADAAKMLRPILEEGMETTFKSTYEVENALVKAVLYDHQHRVGNNYMLREFNGLIEALQNKFVTENGYGVEDRKISTFVKKIGNILEDISEGGSLPVFFKNKEARNTYFKQMISDTLRVYKNQMDIAGSINKELDKDRLMEIFGVVSGHSYNGNMKSDYAAASGREILGEITQLLADRWGLSGAERDRLWVKNDMTVIDDVWNRVAEKYTQDPLMIETLGGNTFGVKPMGMGQLYYSGRFKHKGSDTDTMNKSMVDNIKRLRGSGVMLSEGNFKEYTDRLYRALNKSLVDLIATYSQEKFTEVGENPIAWRASLNYMKQLSGSTHSFTDKVQASALHTGDLVQFLNNPNAKRYRVDKVKGTVLLPKKLQERDHTYTGVVESVKDGFVKVRMGIDSYDAMKENDYIMMPLNSAHHVLRASTQDSVKSIAQKFSRWFSTNPNELERAIKIANVDALGVVKLVDGISKTIAGFSAFALIGGAGAPSFMISNNANLVALKHYGLRAWGRQLPGAGSKQVEKFAPLVENDLTGGFFTEMVEQGKYGLKFVDALKRVSGKKRGSVQANEATGIQALPELLVASKDFVKNTLGTWVGLTQKTEQWQRKRTINERMKHTLDDRSLDDVSSVDKVLIDASSRIATWTIAGMFGASRPQGSNTIAGRLLNQFLPWRAAQIDSMLPMTRNKRVGDYMKATKEGGADYGDWLTPATDRKFDPRIKFPYPMPHGKVKEIYASESAATYHRFAEAVGVSLISRYVMSAVSAGLGAWMIGKLTGMDTAEAEDKVDTLVDWAYDKIPLADLFFDSTEFWMSSTPRFFGPVEQMVDAGADLVDNAYHSFVRGEDTDYPTVDGGLDLSRSNRYLINSTEDVVKSPSNLRVMTKDGLTVQEKKEDFYNVDKDIQERMFKLISPFMNSVDAFVQALSPGVGASVVGQELALALEYCIVNMMKENASLPDDRSFYDFAQQKMMNEAWQKPFGIAGRVAGNKFAGTKYIGDFNMSPDLNLNLARASIGIGSPTNYHLKKKIDEHKQMQKVYDEFGELEKFNQRTGEVAEHNAPGQATPEAKRAYMRAVKKWEKTHEAK